MGTLPPSQRTTPPEPPPTSEVPPGQEADSSRQRQWGWVGLTLVVVVVLAFGSLLAFGFSRDPRLLPTPLVGKPAPDFTLRDMETGRQVSLADLRGQVVILNFWASWCLACREEHPGFVLAWNRYRDQGVVFLGIVFQDTAESARQYMREMGGSWPSLLDPGTRTAIKYGVYGVPETFFIRRDGTVAHKRVGATSYLELQRWIERLLSRSSSAAGQEG
jgi:cytochrome c biogenesis protein CcmG/thiol:disulfide interchange protein DsbE